MAIYSPYMKQCSCYKTRYLLEEKYLSYRRGCLLGEKGSMLGMEKGRAENEERGRAEKGEGRGRAKLGVKILVADYVLRSVSDSTL